MDLGQLRYFSKIVEHRSFTRAARDCSVSQPALSQQIAKLEKELGQPLFERQGKSVCLTAAGQILQARSTQILQLVDEAKRQITDDGETGRIGISAIPTIAPYFLPIVLKEVGSQFPQAQFEISEDTTAKLLSRCSSGDIDVGLVALPASAKNVVFEPLFTEELLLALPASHPLVHKPKISSKDLAQESFILLNVTHCLVDAIEAYCSSRNFQPVAKSRIEQLSTVQNLVALGYGLSFVPRMATLENLSGRIVYRSLHGDKPTRKIAMCYNPIRFQNQLLTNFLKGLREFGGSDWIDVSSPTVESSAEEVSRWIH